MYTYVALQRQHAVKFFLNLEVIEYTNTDGQYYCVSINA
jgi:hypothetical protein